MTHTQRETLRHAILRLGAANVSRWGIGAEAMRLYVQRYAFDLPTEDIAVEMQYLEDKGLLVRVPKVISPDVPAWRITATGRDLVAEHE